MMAAVLLPILATGTMAADSAFTVIVARTITLDGSTDLALDRDHDATGVPKDDTMKGGGGKLRLVRWFSVPARPQRLPRGQSSAWDAKSDGATAL